MLKQKFNCKIKRRFYNYNSEKEYWVRGNITGEIEEGKILINWRTGEKQSNYVIDITGKGNLIMVKDVNKA